MLYNVWLEVAALGFIFIIWFFYKLQYKTQSAINLQFERMTVCIFFLVVTDIASAIGISYYENVPIWINYLLNGTNYVLIGLSAYAFIRYIRTLVKRTTTVMSYIESALALLHTFSEIFNIPFGYYFTFDELGYHHGAYYLVPIVVPYMFILDSAIIILHYTKNLSARKIAGAFSYILMMLIAGAVQVFVAPDFLLTGFASAMMLLIIFMLMETPDYYKLNATMAELEKARAEANEANEAKSRFLANMSHEIRTPLNAVLGMGEMILREETNPEILDYAKNIKNSGSTLLGIINDILDFSKIESGKLEIIPGNYNISNVADNIFIMLRQKTMDKDLRFSVTLDSDLPKTLYGDEKRITQIIINLVNNAIKYTEEGGVELHIAKKPCEEENKIVLCISVKDTGIGIRDEDKEKLFGEFERVDLEHNRNIEGTGLGLAITSRLLRNMDGRIKVDSVYGKGSVFEVEIPQGVVNATPVSVKEVVTVKAEDAQIQEHFTAPNAKILGIDDNRVNLVVLKNYLKFSKVQFTAVQSGKDALKKIEEDDFDIVFVDHMMPEMDGIETFRRAKEIEKQTGRKAVYIVLTANAIQGADKQYLEEGFDAYLSKPIDSTALDNLLIKYLKP